MKVLNFSLFNVPVAVISVFFLCSFADAAPLCPAKKSESAKEGKLKSVKQVAINCPTGTRPDEICKIRGLSGDLTDENVKVTDLAKVPCVAKKNYFLEGKAIRVTGGCRGTFHIGSSKMESRCTFAGMEALEDTCCEGLVFLEGTRTCAFPYKALTLESLLYAGLPAVENNCEIKLSEEFKKRLSQDEELLGIAENLFTAIDTADMNFSKRMSEDVLKAEMNPIMKGTFGLPAILFNAFTNYRYAMFTAQKNFNEQASIAMNESAAAANGGNLKISKITCPSLEAEATEGIHECSVGSGVVVDKSVSIGVSERFSTTPCMGESVVANPEMGASINSIGKKEDFGFVTGAPDKIWARGKCRGVFEVRYVPGARDTNPNVFVLPEGSPYKGLTEQEIYPLVMKNIMTNQSALYEAMGAATEQLDENLEKGMQLGSDLAWLCAHKRQCFERQWSLRPVKGRAEKFFDPVYSLQAPSKFVQKIKGGKLKGQLKKRINLKAKDWSEFLEWSDKYEHYNFLYTSLGQTGLEKGGEKTASLLREYAVEKDFPCLENDRTARSPVGKIEVPLKLRAAALNLIAYYKAMIDLNHNRVTLCPPGLPTPTPGPTATYTPGMVPTSGPGTPVTMNPSDINISGIPDSSLSGGSARTEKSGAGSGSKFASDRLRPGSNFGRAAFFNRAAKRLADAKNAADKIAGKNPSWNKASSLLANSIARNVPGGFGSGGLSSSSGSAPSSSLPSSTSAAGEGKNILGLGGSSVGMKSAGSASIQAGVQGGSAISDHSVDSEEDADDSDDGDKNVTAEGEEDDSSEESLDSICNQSAGRGDIAAPSDSLFIGVMCAYRRHYPEAVKEMGIPKLSGETEE